MALVEEEPGADQQRGAEEREDHARRLVDPAAADGHDEEEDGAENDRRASGPAEHATAEQLLEVERATRQLLVRRLRLLRRDHPRRSGPRGRTRRRPLEAQLEPLDAIEELVELLFECVQPLRCVVLHPAVPARR